MGFQFINKYVFHRMSGCVCVWMYIVKVFGLYVIVGGVEYIYN